MPKKEEKADIEEDLGNVVNELKKNILTEIKEERPDSSKKSDAESDDNKKSIK